MKTVLLILLVLIIGCSERKKTPDEVQLQFFKKEIEYRKQVNNLN